MGLNVFPGRIVDSVNGLVGKVKLLILKTVTFNATTPYLLEFKDQDGSLLDSVEVAIPNVQNLQAELDKKVAQADVSDINQNLTKHNIAQVGTVTITETVTKLNPTELEGNTLPIKYNNENGVEQVINVDLSGLTLTDNSISNASYNASTNIITLTEDDGTTHTIDLSEFSIIVNTDANGVTTLTQEGVVKATLSRVGQTGEYDHLINRPDLSVFLTENNLTTTERTFTAKQTFGEIAVPIAIESTHAVNLQQVKSVRDLTIVKKSASFTITDADHWRFFRITGTTNITITVSWGLMADFRAVIKRAGTGTVTIVGATDVVLEYPSGFSPEISQQYDAIEIKKEDENTTTDFVGVFGALKPTT